MSQIPKYLSVLKGVIITLIIFGNEPMIAQDFLFRFTDNINTIENRIVYTLRNDSVIITGISDGGKEKLLYHHEAVSKSDYRTFKKFLKKSGLGNLDSEIINEPDLVYSGGGMHGTSPRDIEIQYFDNGNAKTIHIYNCWVQSVHSVIEELNFLIPDEVRIIYMKEDFNLNLY